METEKWDGWERYIDHDDDVCPPFTTSTATKVR